MGVDAGQVQKWLDAEHPGFTVRGAFEAHRRGGPSGSDLPSLPDTDGCLYLLPIWALIVVISALRDWRRNPDGSRYLVVVTDHGIALGRLRGLLRTRLRRWEHGPINGRRYELDPSNHRFASYGLLTIGEHVYHIGGRNRDAAYRLAGSQPH